MKLFNAIVLVSLCSLLAVHGQPSNDECVDATEVSLGSRTGFSTAGATTSQNQYCLSRNDIWYKFDAPAGSPVVISTCNAYNGSTNFDNIIATYRACGANTISQYCYSRTCGEVGSQGASVVFTPTAAATYYVKLGTTTVSDTDNGSGALSIYSPDTLVTAPTLRSTYYANDEVYILWYTSNAPNTYVDISWASTTAGGPSGVIDLRVPNTGSYLWRVPASMPKDVGTTYTKVIRVRSQTTGTTSESPMFRVLDNYVRWRSWNTVVYPGVPFLATWSYNGPDEAPVDVDLYLNTIPQGQTGFVVGIARGIPVSQGAAGVHLTIPAAANINIPASGLACTIRVHFTSTEAGPNDSRGYVLVSNPSTPLPAGNLRAIDSTITSSSVMLSWVAPVIPNGGLPVTEYWLNISNVPGHFVPAGSSFEVKNLAPQTTYTASLMAYNGVLYSPPSNVVTFTTLPSPGGENYPDNPTGFHCVAFEPNVIVVGWGYAAQPNGGYMVTVNVKSGRSYPISNYITHDPSATFIDLAPGVTYEFQVFTRSSPTGSRLSSGSSRVQCSTSPSAPRTPDMPRLTQWGSFDIKIEWAAPYINGGSDITNYRISYRSPADPEAQLVMTNQVSTNYHLEGLQPGTQYLISVAAMNTIGASGDSDTLVVTTDSFSYVGATTTTGASAPTDYITNITSSTFGSSFFACMLAAVVLGVFFGVYRMWGRIRALVTGNKYSAPANYDEQESFSRSFSRG